MPLPNKDALKCLVKDFLTIGIILPKRVEYEFKLKSGPMTYQDFVDQYKPIQNTNIGSSGSFGNTMFETYGAELDLVHGVNNLEPKKVCTIIEVEDKFYILKGFHFVNRWGYFILENPVEENFNQILID